MISFNDILKMNMMKLQEAVNEETIERFLGDKKSLAEGRDYVDFSNGDWVAYEKILIQDTTENLYRILAFNPALFAMAVSTKDLKKPETVKGYSYNIKKLYDKLLQFESEVGLAVDMHVDHNYLLFNNPNVRKDFTDFMVFMKHLMPYFDYAIKVDNVCSKTREPSVEFFNIINKFNSDIRETLAGALPYTGTWTDLGENFISMYTTIYLHFDGYSRHVDLEREIYDIRAQRQREESEEKLKIAKLRSPIISEKETERRNAIKEANDLYEMFQMDFMRDLNREVSMMNRDMYDALITKIEKFLAKFPMPLSDNVSLGMAQEAKAQINKFIDMVGEISRNTYNPVVIPIFGK